MSLSYYFIVTSISLFGDIFLGILSGDYFLNHNAHAEVVVTCRICGVNIYMNIFFLLVPIPGFTVSTDHMFCCRIHKMTLE